MSLAPHAWIAGGGASVRVNVLWLVRPPASVTVTTMLDVPPWVGVPERWPSADRCSPAGKELADQVYGGVPPLAVKVVLYGSVARPDGRVLAVVMTGGAIGTMV